MLLEQRGHIALTGQDIANLDTPLCHLTIPMLIVPGLVYGVLIFPTKLFSDLGRTACSFSPRSCSGGSFREGWSRARC